MALNVQMAEGPQRILLDGEAASPRNRGSLGRAKQVGELSQVLFLLDLITQVVDTIMQSSQWDTQRLQLSAALPSQSARPISVRGLKNRDSDAG